MLLKNHEAISQDKFNLGRTDTLMHEIALKTSEPVYVKQFKIPDAHRQEVEKHVLDDVQVVADEEVGQAKVLLELHQGCYTSKANRARQSDKQVGEQG